MLSRVADSLYWMSRYMERSDGILRMLKTNYAYSQDDGTDFSWRAVLTIFSESSEEQINRISQNNREVLKYLITDKSNRNSVINIVSNARENARAVQDNVTKELWQCLNDYYHLIRSNDLENAIQYDDPISVIDELIKQGLYYYGTTEITLARDGGYYFINLGKFLERAMQSVDTLDVKLRELDYCLDASEDPSYWKYLLLSISGYEIFLKSYRSALEPKNVIDQIIWNHSFPRSILYSVTRLKQSFETIKTDKSAESYKTVSFMIGKLHAQIKYTNMADLERIGFKKYLQSTKEALGDIGNALNHYYFAFK
ncbi:alpha-E domain-containing protein [Sphingobacterium wenxiniae]|uniref:Uncharacterized conserved protein, Alpha-E superfamily n=1 Tax=Sphingobacterium wenxiniae TaxID=683125 RepID=A0A1I6SCA0_9SPHI|nr:alpha-E domain-containing protein [Sphingobacterium wenxiniae]SFS74559.1 Uncharacterized conserved protein, Alpha-E superfamily [Sphingobacterium wenxiniae]